MIELYREHQAECRPSAEAHLWHGATELNFTSSWAACNLSGEGIVFRRSYTPETRAVPMLIKQADSRMSLIFHLLDSLNLLKPVIWGLTMQIARQRRGRPFIDRLREDIFMMDMNIKARRVARHLGFRVRILQQAYTLPFDPQVPDSAAGERCVAFLEAVREVCGKHRIRPSYLDLLTSPPDDTLLSSNPDSAGMIITVTEQFVGTRRWPLLQQAFAELAERCAELGGKVHLTKNVCASPAILAQMYGIPFEKWAALKRRLDPEGIFRNYFLERLIPLSWSG